MTNGSDPTGHVWHTPAIRIEQVQVAEGTRLRGHGHDVPHFCFLERGGFEERHAGRWRPVAPGTLRSSPADDAHDILFRAPSRCVLVFVLGDPGATTPRLPEARRFATSSRLQALARRLLRDLGPRTDASPLSVEATVLELIAATLPDGPADRTGEPPPWLLRVRERLDDQPGQAVSASDLASATGYHPVYVARAFRRYFGIGLGEYARLLRAERARALLRRSDEPLAWVAAETGYADQSHLSRAMRRFLGATPTQVRRGDARLAQVASVQEPRGRAA